MRFGLITVVLLQVSSGFQVSHQTIPSLRRNGISSRCQEQESWHRRIVHKRSAVPELFERDQATDDFANADSELSRLQYGWHLVTTGQALNPSNLGKLWTPEDLVATVAVLPLSIESLHTAFTGQVHPDYYIACALLSISCAAAHSKMCLDTPRDWRSPRLGELRTVYQYSPLFTIPFA